MKDSLIMSAFKSQVNTLYKNTSRISQRSANGGPRVISLIFSKIFVDCKFAQQYENSVQSNHTSHRSLLESSLIIIRISLEFWDWNMKKFDHEFYLGKVPSCDCPNAILVITISRTVCGHQCLGTKYLHLLNILSILLKSHFLIYYF
jgi:hypothetical protein